MANKCYVMLCYVMFNRGAVQCWILTVHYRAKTLQTSREMTCIYDAESKQYKDASVPRMKKDENKCPQRHGHRELD